MSVYLSYKALLRMCELVCITYGDFVITENHQSFILALYEGKTVTLHGKDENVKVDKSVFVDSMSTSFAGVAGFEPWTFDLRVTVHNDIFILQHLAQLKI